MKRTLIFTLTILATGLSFAAENRPALRKPYLEKPRAPELRYGVEEGIEAMGEKIASGIEKAPQAIDSVSAMLDKAPDVVEKVVSTAEKLNPRKSHVYLRMNMTETTPGKRGPFVPGIGVGFRRVAGHSAIDFSAGYTSGKSHGRKSELITLPKLGYLYYLTPIQDRSFYAGPALAFGRVKTIQGNRFQGLIPSASVGYELSRKANMLSFFQLDVSWPLIAAKARGPLPGPIAELAFGAGF